MQIVSLALSHDLLFCPATGKQILFEDDMDETVPSLLGYALLDMPEEAHFFDEDINTAWQAYLEKTEDVDYEDLEQFLKEYKHSTAIVFEISRGGMACGPVSNTAYFIIDMDAQPLAYYREKDLAREMHYGLRVYSQTGEIIESYDGAGDLGPIFYTGDITALLIIDDDNDLKTYLGEQGIGYQKAGRIGVWEIDDEDATIENGIMIHGQTKETCKAIARQFKLSFFYFFDWDGVRCITIEDVETDVSLLYARGED